MLEYIPKFIWSEYETIALRNNHLICLSEMYILSSDKRLTIFSHSWRAVPITYTGSALGRALINASMNRRNDYSQDNLPFHIILIACECIIFTSDTACGAVGMDRMPV